jgi:Flp pilus assembly protein TadD
MGANPPEALVNLGIAYDRAGQSKQAYDAWVKAKSKNARAPKLQDWIDAKKRIFGY